MTKLGLSMDKVILPQSVPRILAGYTYFGQFIDHDLTGDDTPLERAEPDEAQIRNFQSPFLDLDYVYGGGSNVPPHRCRKRGTNSPEGAERFLMETTREAGARKPSENDLPRNSEDVALTGDPHQDENLILAQLHVAFLELQSGNVRCLVG